MIKLALLCTDTREAYRKYRKADPYFGAAPEALMQGFATLPVVGTYPGGATTLVRDAVEGFVVPPRDSPRLAEAMICAATDRELNQRMGKAAYRNGTIGNTWQDDGDRLLAQYGRRLAASQKRTSPPAAVPPP
jgi:glycosyltransferase involved in cell wall biosynthesis